MNTTKHKPNFAAQMNEHEMPEWKGKWRNLYFRKDGTHLIGDSPCDSIAECKKLTGYRKLEKLQERGDFSGLEIKTGTMLYKDYEYAIQIPVSA